MSTFWKIALPFVVIALLIAGGFWFSGRVSDDITSRTPDADETAGTGDDSFATQPTTGSVNDVLAAFTTEADGEASFAADDGSGAQSVVDDTETKDDFLNFYNENEL